MPVASLSVLAAILAILAARLPITCEREAALRANAKHPFRVAAQNLAHGNARKFRIGQRQSGKFFLGGPQCLLHRLRREHSFGLQVTLLRVREIGLGSNIAPPLHRCSLAFRQ